MNNRERKILARHYAILHTVPLPQDGSGSKSASIEGHITYAKDMKVVQIASAIIVFRLCIRELDVAERQLDLLEEWIQKRKALDWKDIFPFPVMEKVD